MVLAELGASLHAALSKLSRSGTVDDAAFDECLRGIVTSLLEADVNVRLVADLRTRVRTKFAERKDSAFGPNKSRLVLQLVAEELVRLLTARQERPTYTKNRSNVVVFVGLQGSGKTTTCAKFAQLYKRKGWRVALVCADTFRAGAFDQLKQNATRIGVPFYGSYAEPDPAKIARDGVERFKQEKFELIIVDTSGRHKQEAALFEEMREIVASVKPTEVIFTMDSHIGQMCTEQAGAFASTVEVGSVIVTKLDGHAKGGGALSAVAATGAPIAFLGTGEHFDQFEAFDAEGFVSRLLGMGDIKGLMKTIADVIPLDKQPEMIDRLAKGQFTLRDMRTQLQSMTQMGSMSQLMGMVPGLSNLAGALGGDQESKMAGVLRKFLVILDSFKPSELDSTKPLPPWRIKKIAKGSGTCVQHVEALLQQFRQMSKMICNMSKAMGRKNGGMEKMMRNPQAAMQQMMNNPQAQQLMQAMGGAGGLSGLAGLMDGGFPMMPPFK